MAIDKVTGTAWADLSKISNVAKADIAKVAGQDAPSSGIVTTNLYHNFDAGDSSSYPGSGTTWFDTQNNEDLTLTNGPVYNSSSPAHFDFDRANDYANSSTWNQPTSADLTLEAWVRKDGHGNYNQMIFSSQTDSLADGTLRRTFFLATGRSSSPKPFSKLFDSNQALLGTLQGTQDMSTGTWYHLVVTRSGTTAKLYMNGSLDVTVTLSNTTLNTNCSEIDIGRRAVSTVPDYFNGDIAEVRYYDTGLSAAQVTQNYNATKSKYGY